MTTSFREAYSVLQRHAETLRTQDEPNIDDLLTIVTESVSAYKVCKQRIDAVEEALKAALDGAGVDAPPPATPTPQATNPSPSTPRATARPTHSPATSFDDMDDDIPF
ncbi:exodeoxyribonuclease VII small subunit [Pseudacidovorax sp. RU35E]|jgi:exodeoxyribonuclease VII small subunit|uniref:exodeoxyribonuclease VII small subunit n=1 Tax=Pseudacidovorax sp. RU35E TaxID=1907403 RepID=UPI00095591C1|nr:exodeoxyribonuclease VII small subunit [Pseudacidovorax sp. RU35E]SIR52825.1 Exodeoxyribonuclease VII small subunit [Pseudacidovorax sp. RU35E]